MWLKKYLHSLTKYAAINHVEEEQCSGELQRGSSLSFHKKQQRDIGNNYSHCHFVEEKHPLVRVHWCGSERTVPVMWSWKESRLTVWEAESSTYSLLSRQLQFIQGQSVSIAEIQQLTACLCGFLLKRFQLVHSVFFLSLQLWNHWYIPTHSFRLACQWARLIRLALFQLITFVSIGQIFFSSLI